MFPYIMYPYIPCVPFGVKIDTFTPACQRANHIAYRLVFVILSPITGLFIGVFMPSQLRGTKQKIKN